MIATLTQACIHLWPAYISLSQLTASSWTSDIRIRGGRFLEENLKSLHSPLDFNVSTQLVSLRALNASIGIVFIFRECIVEFGASGDSSYVLTVKMYIFNGKIGFCWVELFILPSWILQMDELSFAYQIFFFNSK